MSEPRPDETPRDGVWVSYYQDRSGVMPHATEIDAQRHGVKHSESVIFVRWGEDIRDAEQRERQETGQ